MEGVDRGRTGHRPAKHGEDLRGLGLTWEDDLDAAEDRDMAGGEALPDVHSIREGLRSKVK